MAAFSVNSFKIYVYNVHNAHFSVSCPPGTFHNATLGTCELCSMGYYQMASGQSGCVVCKAGHTSPDGAISANECACIYTYVFETHVIALMYTYSKVL